MLSVVTLFPQGCVVTVVGKTWLAFVRHVRGLPGYFSLVVTRRVSKVVLQGCVCRSVLCELLSGGCVLVSCAC